MNDKRRRETQAGLSVAIHTLLEAIPHSAFEAFHPSPDEETKPLSLDDARLLLAGEMMASAYLLLEKDLEPRDVLLNVWDLLSTVTEVVSVEHLAALLPPAAGRRKPGEWKIPDRRPKAAAKSKVSEEKPAKKRPVKKAASNRGAARKPAGRRKARESA